MLPERGGGGLFDTKETQDKTCKEISRCILASCPGPHAIVLVLKLGRYTEEEQKTVALIKNLFGEAAMNYMIILFTGKEDLEDQSLSNFLEGSDGNLGSLLQECGDRCCAFSNSKKTEPAEKEAQVQELVELIDKMVQNNRGAYFSDPIYKDIDQKLRQMEEDLMKSYTDTFNMQIEQVEVECGVGAWAPESVDINMAATPNNTLRMVLVGKTGRLFDTKETLDKTCKEISRCVLASCPGPHAIVLDESSLSPHTNQVAPWVLVLPEDMSAAW
ncbi:GIMAP7 [Cervus elaphus hippelaphus]|uniref:GIMAP7 n=1 Tax=Cervus elaphus hippelaphus TaxID=46360 RepID=A0A212CKG7_CEREH|nr:GIMAP7 [Cervus elaphus hippelaphus]